MTKEKISSRPANHQVLISRIFETSVETMFDAWTDPAQIEQWWGPKAFSNAVYDWEARPGGSIHIDMIGPDYSIYPMRGYFHEVNEPERLIFTSTAFENERGQSQLEVLNTAIFIGDQKTTRLTLQAVVIRSSPQTASSVNSMEEGWRQSLDRLAELLVRGT